MGEARGSSPSRSAPPEEDPQILPVTEGVEAGAPRIPGNGLFQEMFAGGARLTKAVRKLGIQTLEPEDAASGGTDFCDALAVRALMDKWRDLYHEGRALVLHFAPPLCHVLTCQG